MISETARTAARRAVRTLAAAGALAGVCLLPPSHTAEARAAGGDCDRIAAPDGSDRAAGTSSRPLASAEALVGALRPGETGCLRGGSYGSDGEISIAVPGVTLRSYPGERALFRGRLWVEREGDGVTISDLDLDGRNPENLPSPTVNADDVVLRGNDITNHHTAICVSVGSPETYGRAHRTLIEGNRIHDCGRLPASNQDHGIYVNSSDDAVIRDNLILGNADRGVQLYPDAQRTLVTGNVIDGNGVGVIFGGNEDSASSDNLVEHNVITNSLIRGNVDYSWGGEPGTGNVARDNCTGGSARDRDRGVLGDEALLGLADAPAVAGYAAGVFGMPQTVLAGTCASTLLAGGSPDR